jgi:hypothetical protein
MTVGSIEADSNPLLMKGKMELIAVRPLDREFLWNINQTGPGGHQNNEVVSSESGAA